MKTLIQKLEHLLEAQSDPSKDPSVGLVVFGTLDILMGIFCFALAMILLIVVSSAGLHDLKPVHFWMTMVLLFYLTGWFIVMGLGSIKGRRWVRALLLVGAWVRDCFRPEKDEVVVKSYQQRLAEEEAAKDKSPNDPAHTDASWIKEKSFGSIF
jgi:hypothetical protein